MKGRLPLTGDVERSCRAIDKRAAAARLRPVGGGVVNAGVVTDASDAFKGCGVDSFRRVYGDLFVPEDIVGYAESYVTRMLDRAAADGDTYSNVMSLFMQAVAIGVLMERARWTERGGHGRLAELGGDDEQV